MSGPGDDGMDGLSACECPVCFNFLSETLPPMSMPCGHTLCSVCVDQLVGKITGVRNGSPTFRCPLCREWVNKDSVTLNHTLRDLIAQLTSIGVNPSKPQNHQARVLSSLHVDFTEIEMGSSLDRGAFGEVFKGRWRGNDIAVKMFSSGILTPEAMQAFQREVFVMNCLRHPNVVLLMGACQTPPKLAILMEFVAGGSLHKLLYVDKTSLTLAQTCSLGSDVCRGLQYLHSINILHRDLKSKNVLLSGAPPTGAGQAKLCDFGLARMRLESATLTGNVGTVHWSAPEVLANSRYQFPADVYSLGMVLYEMSCGCIPFSSMVPLAVMMAVAVKKEKPEIPSSVDQRMAQLIARCISWEPDDRLSVGEVLSTLHTITPPHSITPTQERQAHLSHSDSLGMVFVSVTDTADLHQQDEDLVDAARNMGLLQQQDMDLLQQQDMDLLQPQDHQNIQRYPSEDDRVLAREIENSEKQAMLARDEELAHQLQLRENAYLTPSDSKVKILPPKNVLDLIKKVPNSKKHPSGAATKTVPSKASPILPKPAANSNSSAKTTRSKLGSLSSKLAPAKHSSPTKQVSPLPSKKIPSSDSLPKKSLFSKKKSAAKHVPDDKETSVPLKTKSSKMSRLKTSFLKSPNPPPPPPPPPPPLPPLHTRAPHPTPVYRPLNKARFSKRQLLKEIRSESVTIAKKLRPVETIERKGFRVGHVVDGYSSERAQYTVQNLIRSFNPRLLRPVETVEAPSPFPVGRVVPPARGVKVKRLSSLIENPPAPTEKELSPRLSSSARAEIALFKAQWLKQVIPRISNTLPTVEDILNEHAMETDAASVSGVTDASHSVPQQATAEHRLNPTLKVNIVNFNRDLLHSVTTVIKQWSPTMEDIATEKRLSQSEGTSATPQSEGSSATPKNQSTEQLDGFW